jgi:hypothetical protein
MCNLVPHNKVGGYVKLSTAFYIKIELFLFFEYKVFIVTVVTMYNK